MATGYVYHEGLPAAGVQPFMHFENADTKRRMHELIVVSGLIDRLTRLRPEPATEEDLLRVHTPGHVARIREESADPRGGDAGDGFSPFGRGGYEIAALAAGGMIEAVAAVVRGDVDNAYALIRPPGHHAIPSTGMGFCVFNNIAIAARHAQARLGVKRIAVVDWDVHHGNGTQACFWDDPSVLTISLHQDNNFPPNSGAIEERGEGAGDGTAINVPLPPGSGHGGYLHAFDEVVMPALERFAPDLILVACGFDASALDPLGAQILSSATYREMTQRVMRAAERLCGGRVVFSHEGGYSPQYVPFCGAAVIDTLAGGPEVGDPFLPIVSGFGGQGLKEQERAVVAEAARQHGLITEGAAR